MVPSRLNNLRRAAETQNLGKASPLMQPALSFQALDSPDQQTPFTETLLNLFCDIRVQTDDRARRALYCLSWLLLRPA
jgi:hypothetical protein